MPKPHRVTPSLLLVIAALLIASGGVGYAAGTITSADIVDDAVQSRDIRDATIANRDVAIGSIQRNRLSTVCRARESQAFGGCVAHASRGPSTFQAAVADCSSRNGRLPTLLELRWIAAHDDEYAWADGNPSQYEFSSDYTTEYPYTPIAVDTNGFGVNNASGHTFWHHCVTY